MAKLRLLIVNDLLRGGGVEKLMQDLVWAWHEKYDITIRTDWYDTEYLEVIPEDVKYYSMFSKDIIRSEDFIARKRNKLANIRQKKMLKSLETDDNFDIVIAIKDGAIVKCVSEMNITRKMAWIHTDYSANYYTRPIFGEPYEELEVMKKFEKIVCVAERIKESIIEVIGDPGNLVTKYNPIDINQVLEKSTEHVADVDPKVPGVTRFVSAGRLNWQKGYGLLLEACHMLEREGYKFEVIVAGGREEWSNEYDRLTNAINRLNVTSVKFIGGRKNPYKYMKLADWFISSSVFEGYSLVSQEAAILDIPLILTDVSGVRELLGDSEYGIVADPSVIGIYESMKKVLDDPALKDYYTDKIKERKATITYRERIDSIEELFN